MTKEFNPSAAASDDSGVFGLPYTESDSQMILVPVPWEATTSYGGGTSKGPSAIFNASKQVDLYDLEVRKPYESGIFMLPESRDIMGLNEKAITFADKGNLTEVNNLCEKMNQFVYTETKKILSHNKIAGIVGGDHSVPFGGFKALAEKYSDFGILHFDAHSDTRKAFEDYKWSHASIMYNVLSEIPQMKKLVQVGIRDVCEEEIEFCKSQGHRVQMYSDYSLADKKFKGSSWDLIAKEIVNGLPKEVWVSFDIDGLDPKLCPSTGTPVPGGLEFSEATYIIGALVRSGRKIVGFDLNEVAPGETEWDANVGARMLYKLCAWTFASWGKAKIL
jgi:agmatinase